LTGAPAKHFLAGDGARPHAALPLPAELQEPVPDVGEFEWQLRCCRRLFRLVERMALGSVDVVADRVTVGGLA